MVLTPGDERFPNNWYTRAVGDSYDIPKFLTDLTHFVQRSAVTRAQGTHSLLWTSPI